MCFRSVSARPAPPTDFLSHLELAQRFNWWELHRAAGISAWFNEEKAMALARGRKDPYLARLDLSQADPKMPWAQTGRHPDHVTIWAPPALVLQAVVAYADIG